MHCRRTPFVIDAALLLENGKPVFTSNRRDSSFLVKHIEKCKTLFLEVVGFHNSLDCEIHAPNDPVSNQVIIAAWDTCLYPVSEG